MSNKKMIEELQYPDLTSVQSDLIDNSGNDFLRGLVVMVPFHNRQNVRELPGFESTSKGGLWWKLDFRNALEEDLYTSSDASWKTAIDVLMKNLIRFEIDIVIFYWE